MDAENDLESGGSGGAVAVEAWAYPADKRLKEKQPFTWLGAAPYIAVFLAGLALCAAGAVVIDSGGPATTTEQPQGQDNSQQPRYYMTTMEKVGTALLCAGTLLALLAIFAGASATDKGCCEPNLRRFGPD